MLLKKPGQDFVPMINLLLPATLQPPFRTDPNILQEHGLRKSAVHHPLKFRRKPTWFQRRINLIPEENQVDFDAGSIWIVDQTENTIAKHIIGYLANEAIILWQVTYAAEKAQTGFCLDDQPASSSYLATAFSDWPWIVREVSGEKRFCIGSPYRASL